MPNKKFFDRLMEVEVRKREIIDQLTNEEDELWAGATDEDIEEYVKISLKMAKGNEGLRRMITRKRRNTARKALLENT